MKLICDYLNELAAGPLPRRVPRHTDDLESLRLLKALGWVDAEVPRGQGEPMVNGITFAGKAALDKWLGPQVSPQGQTRAARPG